LYGRVRVRSASGSRHSRDRCIALCAGVGERGRRAEARDRSGGDRFGLAKAKTIRELTAVLGRPSAHFVNSGCGARFSETAWGHLYVEFRDGRFSGFRYIENGWPPTRYGTKPRPSVLPRLATSRGITLGSTLGQVRRAYGRLDLVGTDRWMVRRGLIFCDDSKTEPPAASSRIIEIKIGTCGDF
jgi:hypothetical protein